MVSCSFVITVRNFWLLCTLYKLCVTFWNCIYEGVDCSCYVWNMAEFCVYSFILPDSWNASAFIV